MAKFLDTQAISNELMKLIKDAKEKIVLISYSFKVNPQIQERLRTKSKIGTLSEIVIVYGRTELKAAELEWIKDIQDLKIYEKSNLHAKCYLNEDRAIICSMNLYDYSQQNNIEMGILITKEEDKVAYEELMDEINNIKVNGVRKSLDDLQNKEKTVKETSTQTLNEKNIKDVDISSVYDDLNPEQKLNFQLLKHWRLAKSKEEKTPAFLILTDQEITKLASQKKLEKTGIYDTVPKKNAIRYAEQILGILSYNSKYTIGTILSVWYQSDTSKYDRVKLKITKTGEEKWFDTTQELPQKDKIVAVMLNGTWFNDYLYLDR
jgi:hypothetical protein